MVTFSRSLIADTKVVAEETLENGEKNQRNSL